MRQKFVGAVHRYLHDHTLSHKYACALALDAVDVDKDSSAQVTAMQACRHAPSCPHTHLVCLVCLLGGQSWRYLSDFVDTARREVVQREAGGVAEACDLVSLHPEFVLPYLVHVLAHHPDFPTQDEGAQFYEPFKM